MRISLLPIAALLFLVTCREEPSPKPPAEPPPAKPAPKKGTAVRLNEDGVSVESKDADVNISPDSVSIELPPKK